jgi:hypothetical protein
MEKRNAVCTVETFAAYQEKLLGMSWSNIDEVVSCFNEDLTWADGYFVARIVATVAGSRRNNLELIEFMKKISESRGYSALLRQIYEIEKLIEDASLAEGIANDLTKDHEKSGMKSAVAHDSVVSIVRGHLDLVRIRLGALRPLVEAIKDPVVLRYAAAQRAPTRGWRRFIVQAALGDAENHDNHGPLRRAVDELARIEFDAEPVVTKAEALMVAGLNKGALKSRVMAALKVVVEPLRIGLRTLRELVEAASGFDELDAACAAAVRKSALEIFALQWGMWRGTAQRPEVNPLAAAIVAQDVKTMRELIPQQLYALRDLIDVDDLPLDFPRMPLHWAGLLDVAAAVGGEVLPALLESYHLQSDPDRSTYGDTLEQAIAVGEPETIGLIWERMAAESRVKCDGALITSIDYHHAEVTLWLIAEHPPWLGLARRVAREKRAFDVLGLLPEGAEVLPRLCPLVEKHAKALEQLGVPLGSLRRPFVSCEQMPENFGLWLCRAGQSLLLLEAEDGRVLGAWISVRWSTRGSEAKDVWCRSFLFTIEGERARRFPAVTPPGVAYDDGQFYVAELTVSRKERKYWVQADSSCTGGQFPVLLGKVAKWGIYPL